MADPSPKKSGDFGPVDFRRRFADFLRPVSQKRPPLDVGQSNLPYVVPTQGVCGKTDTHAHPAMRQHWRRDLQQMLVTIRREKWTAYAFGGTARGLLHRGSTYVPRDVDLVFAEEHFSAFQQHFHPLVRDTNRFGGLRMRAGHVDIDAWPITRTWAFQRCASLNASFENLPKTTFLNIDALAVELFPKAGAARRIFDGGCLKAHEERMLDINFHDNPLPDLCVVRSLYYAYKFNFGVSAQLAKYLRQEMDSFGLQHFVAVQSRHYGQIWFGLNMLDRVFDQLGRKTIGAVSCAQLFGLQHQQRILLWKTTADR